MPLPPSDPPDPGLAVVSIRLPADLLEKVKAAAIAEDLPYTIFIRRVLRKALQKTSRSQAA